MLYRMSVYLYSIALSPVTKWVYRAVHWGLLLLFFYFWNQVRVTNGAQIDTLRLFSWVLPAGKSVAATAVGIIFFSSPDRPWAFLARCMVAWAARHGEVIAVMDVARDAVQELEVDLRWTPTYRDTPLQVRTLNALQVRTVSAAAAGPAALTSRDQRHEKNIWQWIRQFSTTIWLKLQKLYASWRRSRAKTVVEMLNRIPESEPDYAVAQYFLGLFHLRGPLLANNKLAEDYLECAYKLGHVEAGAELALARLRAGPASKAAAKILDDCLPSLPDGKLKDVVRLELAKLELGAMVGSSRNLGRAKELTDALLGFPSDRADGSAPAMLDACAYTPQSIRNEAATVRSLVEEEVNAETRRSEERRVHDDLFSFITHSIPSAMSSVVGQTEGSLEILADHSSSLDADRDLLIRYLSGVLGRAEHINSLMATHRLLIAGEDRLNRAWAQEQSERPFQPHYLMLDAAKQAIAHTMFVERNFEQLDLAEAEDNAINELRAISLTHLASVTAGPQDSDTFLEYLSRHLSFVRLRWATGIEWHAAPNGIRQGVVQSIVSELLRNALKHRVAGTTLDACLAASADGFSISVSNGYDTKSASLSGGTRRGLVFVKEFCEVIDSLGFSTERSADRHIAHLVVSGDPR